MHYLADGVRGWYLALTVPVPLFAEAPAPRGWSEARRVLERHLTTPADATRAAASNALQTLARANYQPSLLQNAAARPASATPRKKISGGCG
jgi:hypothetical protein